MIRAALFIALAIFLTGCMTYKYPQQIEFDKKVSVAVPYDEAWAQAVEWFAEKNISIQTMEKASGLIAAERTAFSDGSRFADCGGVEGFPPSSPDSMKFNALLKPVSSTQTSIMFNMISHYTHIVRDLYGREISRSTIDCHSRGTLEADFFNFIRIGPRR